jgi:hypothetical protein
VETWSSESTWSNFSLQIGFLYPIEERTNPITTIAPILKGKRKQLISSKPTAKHNFNLL